MKKLKRPMLGIILLLLLMVMVFELNTKPQEAYEVIQVTATMNVQPLLDAGYLGRSGYLTIQGNDVYPRETPCPVCEAMQSGNITFTSGLESSDNFTIIPKDFPFNSFNSMFRGLE